MPHDASEETTLPSLNGRRFRLLANTSGGQTLGGNPISFDTFNGLELDGGDVWVGNPVDALRASDQKLWLHWLAVHHYTVSIGVMQVNAEVAPQFHVKPEQLLDELNPQHGANGRIAGCIGHGLSHFRSGRFASLIEDVHNLPLAPAQSPRCAQSLASC